VQEFQVATNSYAPEFGRATGGIINVVREDPKTRGLLFAGSETQVYVSFDDGDHWQTLRLNMPAISIRDLTIHEDDLIAGTHGRGFWILDDLEPLRQIKSVAGNHLFKPQRAWRFRWSKYSDTPMPPDEPAGQNPPDGAIIDYYLSSPAQTVWLDILDAKGKVIRHYSSTDKADAPKDSGNIPWYWIRPPQVLSTATGMHRFTWDLHYPPSSTHAQYPISAIPYSTAPQPTSPWVLPGTYTVRLTADGHQFTQPLTVRMDPRVKTPADDGFYRHTPVSARARRLCPDAFCHPMRPRFLMASICRSRRVVVVSLGMAVARGGMMTEAPG